ncbi:Ovarian cancer-associated protein 2 [Blyttiomyces sp. JEL0837]|nr:Ovarian cancer-associated protein 2 [Blyttiomyces sp. JEL0837]
MAASTPSKLRILCLHGYTQNEAAFRKRTAVLRKDLEPYADLIYVSAPYIVPMTEEEGKADAIRYQSFLARDENAGRAWWLPLPDRSDHIGYAESIEMMKQFWISHGPFDGILGFSQGAAFAALLATELAHPTSTPRLSNPPLTESIPTIELTSTSLNTKITLQATLAALSISSTPRGPLQLPRFMILISGFSSISGAHDGVLERWSSLGGIDVPSLHVIGESDAWVHPERSRDLASLFKEGSAALLYHDGGHFVPTKADMRTKLKEFISGFAASANAGTAAMMLD